MREFLSELPARYFEEISAIPRASGNEAAIADYLAAFAAARGLSCYRDAANNVLVKKAASQGREGEPALLLQAHTDMVAEKNANVSHDFEKEGIRLSKKGNILSANGTTLGADNGCGVAMMLAALDGGAASHPPLECLFTASEEIGLIGAKAFDYSKISAQRILNLDSTDEGEIIVGCCGGVRSEISLPVAVNDSAENAVRLFLSGLAGGHSGEDIDKGRANAHVTMGRVLQRLKEYSDFRLCSISGGDKDNAIPRECAAVLIADDSKGLAAFLKEAEAILAASLTSPDDKAASLAAEEVVAERVLTHESTASVLSVLGVENGVLEARGGKPYTSRNLAKIETTHDTVIFGFSSRGANEQTLDKATAQLDELAATLGGSTRHFSRYPGWDGAEDSPLCRAWQSAYARVTGKNCRATTIHAGLECGIISAALGGAEAISVCCNIRHLHTPAEYVELDSFERVWQTLLDFLKY